MGELSQNLINKLNLENEKPNFKRSFNYKIFPFFTRNPERAKFTNGFDPVLGAMSRLSLYLNPNFESKDYSINEIVENVDSVVLNDGSEMDEEAKRKFLLNIFDYSHLKSFKHPYLINYLTLSEGNEKRGEVDVAKFIVQLFKLKSNRYWHEFVEDTSTSNLVEKLLISSLNEIEEKDVENNFIVTLKDILEVRYEDLNYLLKHKDFAIKYLNLFFAFYYFQYLMQTALNIDRFNIDNQNMYKLYYTLETEKITSTRVTNQKGFNLIRNLYKNLLPNDNLLGYLNELIESDIFYTLYDIKQMPGNEKEELNNELRSFLIVYKNSTNKEENLSYKLEDNIIIFRKWLSEDLSDETISRFPLSFEEIGDLYFLKRRGQLGKVLTLRKDLIILLTALAVKDEKMIIKDVFIEFEKRGVFLDRYSKEEVVNLFEKMNILDKKSDSGEAKYVKPIL